MGLSGCVKTPPDRALSGGFSDPGATRPERLFLQQLSHDGVIIKWRGEANHACALSVQKALRCLPATAVAGGHKEVRFTHLLPDSRYQYSVGGYTDTSTYFFTAPTTGQLPHDGTIRLWLLGDSGTASEFDADGQLKHPGDAQAVVNGFLSYNASLGSDPIDMILMLGDNAYDSGTDAQWQTAVFDLYGHLLHHSSLWPTIGNHEMGYGKVVLPGMGTFQWRGGSTSSDPGSYRALSDSEPEDMPYLDIFTLPARGEVGGVASGTEQYYAFNFGNLHIVSLDSQLTTRDREQRAAMKQWLIADLMAHDQDWTIVIFHHPPYTRGSHNSDEEFASLAGVDQPIIDIRQEFTQVFEDYGVDLVYSGHSHSYERSYYLKGHRGDADSFDPAVHTRLNSKGFPASGHGAELYPQVSTDSQLDDRVVYTVAGSSGKVSLRDGKLDHPAHALQKHDPQGRHGLAELGSVVVDAGAKQLIARFVDDEGRVLDVVTIEKQ